MKKRKQILSIILVTAMASAALAGCGKTSVGSNESEVVKTSQSESVQESANVNVPDTTLDEATIQFWFLAPGKQKDSEKVYEAFNEMLQEYVPNTTVEFFVAPSSEYGTQFEQMLASGEPIDLTWIGYATKVDQDIKDGNLMPLDDLLENYGAGIKEVLGQDVIDLHRAADGVLYNLPSWQGLAANKRAYYIPTDLAELAGATWLEDTQNIVTKWANDYESVDDLVAVMEQWDKYFGALQANDKLYSGIHPYFLGWWYPTYTTENVPRVADVGVIRGDDSYTVVDALDTEYYKTFMSYMSEFYQKGYWRSDIGSVDLAALQFVTGGEYNDNTTVIYSHNAYTEDDVSAQANVSGVDMSAIYIESAATLAKGNATATAIPYCADEPERAMMVLNAIYSVPELYQLLIYGIEGEHYTVNDDGTIKTPYGGSPSADSDYGVDKWVLGSCVNALDTQDDIPGYYQRLIIRDLKN